MESAQQLKYSLKFGGHNAGEQNIYMENLPRGMKYTLEANVDLPQPKTRQRWESEVDEKGFPFRYMERVDSGGQRKLEIEFSREDLLVTVSVGREDFAIPYLVDMHDPLSLIFAVSKLNLNQGEVQMYPMVGGRVYVERMGDQVVNTPTGEKQTRVYRLRPGMSLVHLDENNLPVRMTQKIGDNVFEADLQEVSQADPRTIGRSENGGQGGRHSRQSESRPRIVAGEPQGERTSQREDGSRPRRRRRRYN